MLNSLAAIYSNGVGAATDFESIATVTVGAGGASSISFTSIPSTYKHLQVRGIVRTNRSGNTNDSLGVQFNSDTNVNNYAFHQLTGDGASAAASWVTSGTFGNTWVGYVPGASALSNTFGAFVFDLLDYTSTNKNKTGRSLAGHDQNGYGFIGLWSELYLSTSAISSMTFISQYGTGFVQNTTIALYGIKG